MNSENGYHYNVMRRAIDAIDVTEGAPLSLESLAAQLNMSPAHFQRVFSRWVGVSPKRYQQYLTLDHARSMLSEHFTTLETSLETGLSGTGRLHDLFIKWEAMSPGEYARKGAGLTINYGWFDSPFGQVLAMATGKGLCGMAFADETGPDAVFADMRGRWPEALYSDDATKVEPWVEAAFAQRGDTQLHLMGAPFQIKVWQALLEIPSGQVTTYSEIAGAIGNPRAVRAVGSAVGKNPVS